MACRSRTSTRCSTSELPDEEWDTVGGLLFGTLEHVPEVGESVELGGWRFIAEEIDGRRISACACRTWRLQTTESVAEPATDDVRR